MPLQVVKEFQQHIKDTLNQAGLLVTHIHITVPVSLANETVADQVIAMVGPPSLWQKYR